MRILIILILCIGCYIVNPAATLAQKDKNLDASLIKICKEDPYATPRVVGKIENAAYVIQRKITKNSGLETTLFKVENGAVVQTLELGALTNEKNVLYLNAKPFGDKLLCYGYQIHDDRNGATQFIQVFSNDLVALGSRQEVAVVDLDSDMVKLGASSANIKNAGILPSPKPIFVSEIYALPSGDHQLWLTTMGTGLSYSIKKINGKKRKDFTKEEKAALYARENKFEVLNITISEAGEITNQKSIPINDPAGGKFDIQVMSKLIDKVEFTKTKSGVIALVEVNKAAPYDGFNAFDDIRFPNVSLYKTMVFNIENDAVVNSYKSPKELNILTRDFVIREDGNCLIVGFYTQKEETNWEGVYSILLSPSLKLISENYLPWKGNFEVDDLDSEQRYSFKKNRKLVPGTIRESELFHLPSGGFLLIGELFGQVVSERNMLNKYSIEFMTTGSIIHPEYVTSVENFFDKIFVFEFSADGTFRKSVDLICKSQRELNSLRKASFATVLDGNDLSITFNDRIDNLNKCESKTFDVQESGKDHLLRSFIFNQDNADSWKESLDIRSMVLFPHARYSNDKIGIDLFTDSKYIFLREMSLE